MMKRTFAALALALLVSAAAAAQDTGKPDPSAPDSGKARAASAKPITLSGSVSEDALTLVDDQDNRWSVANPTALRGVEWARVLVKCRLAPDGNRIQILSVKRTQSDVKYTSNRGDSAFRR